MVLSRPKLNSQCGRGEVGVLIFEVTVEGETGLVSVVGEEGTEPVDLAPPRLARRYRETLPTGKNNYDFQQPPACL